MPTSTDREAWVEREVFNRLRQDESEWPEHIFGHTINMVNTRVPDTCCLRCLMEAVIFLRKASMRWDGGRSFTYQVLAEETGKEATVPVAESRQRPWIP